MLAAFLGTNMWCLWAGNLIYLSAIYTLQVSDCIGILIYHIYEGKYMVRTFCTSNLCIFLATSCFHWRCLTNIYLCPHFCHRCIHMNLFSIIYCKLLLMSLCCLYKSKITAWCAKAPTCVGCGFQGFVLAFTAFCKRLISILWPLDHTAVPLPIMPRAFMPFSCHFYNYYICLFDQTSLLLLNQAFRQFQTCCSSLWKSSYIWFALHFAMQCQYWASLKGSRFNYNLALVHYILIIVLINLW